VFADCGSLAAITLDTNNPAYSVVAGVLFNKYQTTLIQYPAAQAGNIYQIPSSVAGIGDSAFSDCWNLTSITIPNSVTSIGSNAFNNCFSLTKIIIPNSVTNIGTAAFAYCYNLTNAIFPDSVTHIGDAMFYYCPSLTSFTLPNSITSIGSNAFYECFSLTEITIPHSVTNIAGQAFQYCIGLKGIYFEGSAPSVDPTSFAYDNATVYYLPGTTGWGPSLAGLFTGVWTPQMQTSGGGFGVQTNQFGFKIKWASGQTIVVDASTNLSNPVWQPIRTNILNSGSVYFSDPHWTNYRSRFYRLRSP
jgi:hypothetical protein